MKMRNAKLLVLFCAMSLCALASFATNRPPVEAPSGFDDKTNGLTSQNDFDAAMGAFNKIYLEREGLGPVFNIETCLRCHQYPTIGGSGLILVTRAGKFDGKNFIAPQGGTLIQGAATFHPLIKILPPEYNVVVKRVPTNLLGAGYIEAIGDDTLRAIAEVQRKQTNGKIAGKVIEVPVYEAGAKRVGRFGWKNSHASLLSFTAEAMHEEMGLTSPLMPDEVTAFGKSLAAYDRAVDPEVDMNRLELVTKFMRATKAPARLTTLAESPQAKAGESIFASVGCAICHVTSIKTLPEGSSINGGKFKVPEALANKLIHPFSDFLLHDVGTGDGIVETGFQSTRNKIRTAPLWGTGARMQKLGTNMVFLHDGSARILEDAIMRHAGEASLVIDKYKMLAADQKQQLLKYLESL